MPDETTENFTPEPASSPTSPSRTTLMVLGGVGTALLVGLLGFGIGTANADDESNGDGGGHGGMPDGAGMGSGPFAPGDQDRDRDGFGPMPGGPGGGGPGGRLLHGEAVVEDASGDVLTRLSQSGEVTDISNSSITVESSDGFVAEYVVDGDTLVRSPDATDDGGRLDGIESGDSVHVVADAAGGENTALMVGETPDL
jgi:hypothetical protein